MTAGRLLVALAVACAAAALLVGAWVLRRRENRAGAPAGRVGRPASDTPGLRGTPEQDDGFPSTRRRRNH